MAAQGPESKLVLAKLGFDMRDAYDDLLTEPLPPPIQERVASLPGLHEVIDVTTRGPVEAAQMAQAEPERARPDSFITEDGGPIT